ncbi:MAG: hypothetical protein HFI89_10745 [Lachnospiraceae bacterium]|nr:hypothetical protein [Lachnospiraceae bacterium]
MNVTSTNINQSIQVISFYLIRRMSNERQCSEEDALKETLKTMTYELLQDRESGLYAESPEYVWSMLQDEVSGNIKSWIDV